MFRLLIITTSAALVTVAPAAPIPEAAKQPPLYFPTKVGTKCVYDQNGTEETVVVTEVERKGDGWLVTRELQPKVGKRRPKDVVHVSPAGLLVHSEAGDVYDPPLRMLRLPLAGAGWTTEAACGSRPTKLSIACTAAKGGRVKVAAGEFETVKVGCTFTLDGGIKLVGTLYFAAGVGLVKSEVNSKTQSELKSFTPGRN